MVTLIPGRDIRMSPNRVRPFRVGARRRSEEIGAPVEGEGSGRLARS
jgi:hypothetical protein